MKYRSLTHIYFTRLIFESHWSIIPSTIYRQDLKQNHWTIKYRSLTYIYLVRSIYVSHWSIIPTMMFIHQIILKMLSKITRPWNIGHVDLYLLWGQSLGQPVSLSENMTLMQQRDIRQNHWTMKYRSHRPTFILRSNVGSYWPIIPKYYVLISNSLQDVTQNHWNMKYRSQWPIFILRSYWLIIPTNNVHTSNGLPRYKAKSLNHGI